MFPVSTDPAADDFPTSRVRTRAEAEAYVASVCFKHGPPRLMGIELEWTVHHQDDPARPLDTATLVAALGAHAPRSLVPDSPHRPLPNGSVLTVEPGGQVEVSSRPATSMRSLFTVVAADAAHVARRLAREGLVLGEQGTDPWRHPRRILRVPRYAAMETAFDRIGLDGRLMMCSTAGVQVCLDAGEPHRIAPRWSALHALGPVMMATFANSPRLFGEETGWVSTRTRALLRTDPPRTRPGSISDDPAGSWARRVLDTSVVCLRRDGDDWTAPSGISFAEWIHGALPNPPTHDDLDYHLSTVFPPVRPRGYLEVRYLDAQPGEGWMLPAAALIALFREESTVDEVLALTSPAIGRWVHAARHGLRDRTLAQVAEGVFALACRLLDGPDVPAGLSGRLADFVARRIAAAGDR
ncbi:ergothioneine biosynthesis glutamate--cysteine ligase EgtA [Saccharopolyspora indica]|uniref:ergothioneine biosynthesis glutamate--cysteine ligase EgtA n=1 Tax=Saccharopolyspora indica TaxID=1229659 RepID=UPI0022EB8E23|nr:ergothioneine biosynthesis glutamate--cysteine ligase EgtA [Saccharopolyspora indica]MDA3645212.1 ergothioneine biosynthesis glutamate--cysteine ligase EgtA [Saccharopolyspora indica]